MYQDKTFSIFLVGQSKIHLENLIELFPRFTWTNIVSWDFYIKYIVWVITLSRKNDKQKIL